MSAQIVPLREAGSKRNVTSSPKGRKKNSDYRVHEHLTEAQMAKLLTALKRNRHGHRDWLIGLLIYRHGLRVSEACDLRWDDLDLPKRTIIVRRLKGSSDSTHYLERDEVNGLKLLQRQQEADGSKCAYVFVNERGQPFGRMGIGRMIERAGEAAELPSRSTCTCSALDRIRAGGPWNGYQTASALPRARFDHQYGALHRHVARAVQGHLAALTFKGCRAANPWFGPCRGDIERSRSPFPHREPDDGRHFR